MSIGVVCIVWASAILGPSFLGDSRSLPFIIFTIVVIVLLVPVIVFVLFKWNSLIGKELQAGLNTTDEVPSIWDRIRKETDAVKKRKMQWMAALVLIPLGLMLLFWGGILFYGPFFMFIPKEYIVIAFGVAIAWFACLGGTATVMRIAETGVIALTVNMRHRLLGCWGVLLAGFYLVRLWLTPRHVVFSGTVGLVVNTVFLAVLWVLGMIVFAWRIRSQVVDRKVEGKGEAQYI